MKQVAENRTISRPVGELLAFDHADLGYGKRTVVADLSMVLRAGDFLGIVGPNGAGKTTILKAMLGILKPLNGRVRRTSGVRFGYVPQRQSADEVYPLTVLEVTMMGRYPAMGVFARPSRRDRDLVLESLDQVGIADLAEQPFRELSGGQKQRALIARALASEPDVLVLDEPTSDMDIGSGHAIMELLKDLHDSRGLSIVMVSHLLNVVVNYAATFAIVDHGLRMFGSAEEVVSAQKLSEVYGIPVEVAAHGDGRVVLTAGCTCRQDEALSRRLGGSNA